MKAERIATRMSVLGRALPSRVLLVDDDELELELMADRLSAAGFEVARAANGAAAMELIEQQWYPLVITDWLMPVMDGIAFTEALRGRGATDTYIIMLTMREASVDYERGYVAGVDDYLSKRVPDAELFARITAAFNKLALRRSLIRGASLMLDSGRTTANAAPCSLSSRPTQSICSRTTLSIVCTIPCSISGAHATLTAVVRSAADTASVSSVSLRP